MTINLECIAWVYYWLLRNLFGFPMGTLACLPMLIIIIILLKVKWVYWRSVYVKVLTVKFTCVPFKVWWHYLSGISHSLSLPPSPSLLPLSFSLLYSSHSVNHASQSCYTSWAHDPDASTEPEHLNPEVGPKAHQRGRREKYNLVSHQTHIH